MGQIYVLRKQQRNVTKRPGDVSGPLRAWQFRFFEFVTKCESHDSNDMGRLLRRLLPVAKLLQIAEPV